jgi:broad specificity phosphatase PhoE
MSLTVPPATWLCQARRENRPPMGTLYLVRHGQASFGSADYDKLSELGLRQSVRLGEWFAHKGITFDAALTGTLRRQIQTLDGIAQGMLAQAPSALLAPLRWSGLNEYDSAAVIAAIHPLPLPKPDSPEAYRQHFRLLRDGLAQWMAGVVSPRGMPSYNDFVLGVSGALDHIRTLHQGRNVIVVSSGGPIATAVGHVLGTSPQTTIELNLRIRNTSVTEFAFTPKRHMLVSYNALPHLDHPDFAGWISYA